VYSVFTVYTFQKAAAASLSALQERKTFPYTDWLDSEH